MPMPGSPKVQGGRHAAEAANPITVVSSEATDRAIRLRAAASQAGRKWSRTGRPRMVAVINGSATGKSSLRCDTWS